MDWRKDKLQRMLTWCIVGLPLVAAMVASFLPLRPAFHQALVGIVLIWFQVSLMFGAFAKS